MLGLYGEELLNCHPTSKLEDHLLSAVHDCLFNIYVYIMKCMENIIDFSLHFSVSAVEFDSAVWCVCCWLEVVSRKWTSTPIRTLLLCNIQSTNCGTVVTQCVLISDKYVAGVRRKTVKCQMMLSLCWHVLLLKLLFVMPFNSSQQPVLSVERERVLRYDLGYSCSCISAAWNCNKA